MGFVQASFVWWREQRELQGYIKGKKIQVRAVYGTFQDGGMEDQGIDGLLQGSP